MPPNAISAECGKGTWLEVLEKPVGPRLLMTSEVAKLADAQS